MAAPEGGFWELFAAIAAAEGERVYARFDGRPITFADLDRMSASLSAGLAGLGVARGDRVAVMMRNSPVSLALLFALARAGMVWVPVNAALRGEGLRHVLTQSDPRAVIADAEALPRIAECGAPAEGRSLVVAGDPDAALPIERLLATEPLAEAPPPRPDELFAIMYTSGTTGPAKGVMVTHHMLRLAGEGALLVAAARDGDVLFVWEPLYHIGGAQLIVLPLRRRVILAMVSRFSAGRFWQEVRAEGATHIHFLGGILQILLKQPEGPLDRAHGARIAWGGGCPIDVWRPFEGRFGLQIRECYGMTEASSFTTFNDSGPVGSVGRPVPWLTVSLADEAGQPVPVGARGEIVVRSSDPGALTPGYFRNPEATAKALRDGALHTGDSGSFDAHGNLFFHGRLTDSVRVKGENVSAWEVEHVAASHPAVEDCAMIGVAADVGEQDIKLFVKPRAGVSVDLAELSAFIGARVAPYQNPRYLATVEEFERTPSLRIMKHRLSPARDDGFDRLAE
ncbi:AMP-binding protein [Muricoccus radiodurans]|uniref:AMP-binding protein n=1 Tax=Muricoccus radiodurans TaxID=2231721 RepID=UPI003CF104E4